MADEKRPRKVFISFLGTNLYEECTYSFPDGTPSEPVRFIQEATLEYLVSKDKWTKDDYVYIVLTEDSKTNNWNDGHTFKFDFKDSNGNDHTREEKQDDGLFQRLKDFRDDNALDFQIKPILLPKDDGKDEKEKMWKIFDKVFSIIQDEDWLYIDVTHGYRYLPMFLLILCNYAKFLKKAKVKSITYGNYEGRKDGVAPIVDLLPLTQLQDWTFATRSFLETGNANSLTELCREDNNELADILQKVVDDFHTCRSIPLVEGANIAKLIELIGQQTENGNNIPPRRYIISEIESQLSVFTPKKDVNKIEYDNVKNGYEAAIWCFNKQLYQQAITILRENITTDNCVLSNNQEDRYWKDGYGNGEYKESERSKHAYVNDDDLKFIVNKCSKVRNDFDHAGFCTSDKNPDGWNSQEIISKIIEVFKLLINKKFRNKKRMVIKEDQPPYIEKI